MKHASIFAFALLAVGSLVRAQDDDTVNAERPGFTNGAGTVRRPQYEIGVTNYRDRGTKTTFNDGGLLRLPTKSKALEVRLGVPSRAGSVWGDPSVGFKWRFAEDGSKGIGAALIATGTSHGGPQYALEAEHALSPLWNVQTDYVRSGGASAGGLNVGYTATKTLGVFVESYSQADGHWLDGGVTLLSGKNVQLDLNAGVGLDRGNRKRNFVGLGWVKRW